MPIGSELAVDIGKRLSFQFANREIVRNSADLEIYSAIRRLTANTTPFMNAAQVIRTGIPLATSIDQFLNIHQSNAPLIKVGKMAIVRSILDWEKGSYLYFDQNKRDATWKMDKLSSTWYHRLITVLSAGVQDPKCLFDKASFIIFNYDRCLEHFLVNAVRALYNRPFGEAAEICNKVPIYHPYGTVGSLPGWNKQPVVPFGETEDASNLDALADSILTFTEQVNSAEEALIREEVGNAQRVVFLGFSFQEQNMQLIKPIHSTSSVEVYATALGFSDDDSKVIASSIEKTLTANRKSGGSYRDHVKNHLTCVGLFDHYQKTMQL